MKDLMTRVGIHLVEHGWVSDDTTRRAMKRLCEKRLLDLETAKLTDAEFSRRASESPIAPLPEKANAQHYEVPADLYAQVLGPRLKYSCCEWSDGVKSLAEAEERALSTTCARADIRDGQEVLELGCGWGSLTLWMLEQYPRLQVTAVSNSNSQRQWILSQADSRGFRDRLRVITADMNEFSTTRTFDRVVSVEMFEHMRNHRELLRRISQWLRADGRLFVHVFCHERWSYPFDGEDASDWMSRLFFSGGMMPSEALFSQYQEHLVLDQQWRWPGTYYERTANAWVENIDSHRTTLLEVMARVYGRSAARVWLQRWRMLFMAGAELFGFRSGSEWFVSHYVFRHRHLSASGE